MINETHTTNETTRSTRARRILGTAALGLGLLTGGMIAAPAIAGAQDADTPTETETLDLNDNRSDRLQALVEDGTITQDQADAIAESGNGRHSHRGNRGAKLEALTEALGVTVEDLQTARDADQSIADVAVANGVAVQDVIDSLVAAKQEHIDDKVEAGRLTAEEAAERSADLADEVTEKVNTVPSELPEREGCGDRGHRGGGPGTGTA